MPPSAFAPSEPASSLPDWQLVWGVVALQASLQLGWVVYHAYQPALLQGYGFAGLLLPFALLPGVLGLVTEPLSGALSDRWAAHAHGRLLPITLAVSVAGLIFLSVVGLVQRGIPYGSLVLPGLMLAWMVAVQAASSPSLAQLNQAVSLKVLPRAAALMTLSQGLIGACSGSIAQGAMDLGPTFTFLLGAVVLALGLGVLRAMQAPPPARPWPGPAPLPQLPLRLAALLLAIALAIGTLTQVGLTLLPRVHPLSLPGRAPLGAASVVLLSSALVAPWVGRLVSRWGRRRALLRGIPAFSVLLALALLAPPALMLPLLPLLGLIHSLILTSLTATSLAVLPVEWSGLGAGMVLAGLGLASSLCLLRFGSAGSLAAAPVLSVLIPAAALALVTCWLLDHQQRRVNGSGGATMAG